MGEITDAIKAILAVQKDSETLDRFAREEYRKRFIKPPMHGWRRYDTFTVKNKNTITIHYEHGYGDIELTDSFAVQIIE